jgi:hypothetical protein
MSPSSADARLAAVEASLPRERAPAPVDSGAQHDVEELLLLFAHEREATLAKIRRARAIVREAADDDARWRARVAEGRRASRLRLLRRACFEGWRDARRASRAQDLALRASARQWIQTSLRRRVARWRFNALVSAHERLRVARASRHLAKRRARAVLAAWAEAARVGPRARRLATLATCVERRVGRRRSRVAFLRWRFSAARRVDERRERVRAEVIHRRHHLGRVRQRAFRAWRRDAASTKAASTLESSRFEAESRRVRRLAAELERVRGEAARSVADATAAAEASERECERARAAEAESEEARGAFERAIEAEAEAEAEVRALERAREAQTRRRSAVGEEDEEDEDEEASSSPFFHRAGGLGPSASYSATPPGAGIRVRAGCGNTSTAARSRARSPAAALSSRVASLRASFETAAGAAELRVAEAEAEEVLADARAATDERRSRRATRVAAATRLRARAERVAKESVAAAKKSAERLVASVERARQLADVGNTILIARYE